MTRSGVNKAWEASADFAYRKYYMPHLQVLKPASKPRLLSHENETEWNGTIWNCPRKQKNF